MSERRHYFLSQLPNLPQLLQKAPSASANLNGSAEYPGISGDVLFYQTAVGVLVSVQVTGLPASEETCKNRFFAFHIHAGSSCTGTREDAFANTLTHYNPQDCMHPDHAGDLLPILGNHGYAFEVFLTDRFSVDEIVGRTAVIHLGTDDFTTQPAGNAGAKIACGEIKRLFKRL